MMNNIRDIYDSALMMAEKIDHTTLAIGATGFLIGAGIAGGWTLTLIIPTVSITGHALILGLWPVGGAVMNKIAKAIEMNPLIRGALLGSGGYFISYLATNYLFGCSVTLVGPFLGLAAVLGLALTITAVVIPTFFGISMVVTVLNF